MLSNQTTHFAAQVGEFFLQQIDGFLRVGLFAFIMPTEALQQRFGLMIRMVSAATHRARLIVLQLPAQLFDTGAAGQTLTLQQFAGDAQGLFGDRQFILGLDTVLRQAITRLLGRELALVQFGAALVQVLLTGPQPCQLLERTELFAVVLQQGAEQLDLFGHRFRLGTGFFVEHFQLLLLRGQFFAGAGSVLLQGGQFSLAFVQTIADQHQLLQAIAVGIPRIAQRRQVNALFQLSGHPLQAHGHLLLLLKQALNGALPLSAGLFGVLLEVGAGGGFLDQAGEGALFFKGLSQQRCIGGVLALRLDQCSLRSASDWPRVVLAVRSARFAARCAAGSALPAA